MQSKGINFTGRRDICSLSRWSSCLAGGIFDRFGFVGGRRLWFWQVLPIDDTPNAPLFAAIFAILACALLWCLFKRYKNFKPSKLFVKNPNLSLLLFAVENLSLGAFYGGFLACLAAGYFWGERAAGWSVAFAFAFTPVCLIVFVISYMFNEKKN